MIAALFGGTGFIGSYFAQELLEEKDYEKVYLLDIAPVCSKRFDAFLKKHLETRRIVYIPCDVRQGIANQVDIVEEVVDLIANFAAVHREPGHQPEEYYETNLSGAENVCQWAEQKNCKNIIFTSSIAPYGPSDSPKLEGSIPVPVSAYGGSKLAAEKIHMGWQAACKDRRLTIVRPGVVFGAGEGGNVSRLIKAVLGRYFFYIGNKATRKAGTYVKELTHAMLWVHDNNGKPWQGTKLFNMSMNPGPSVQEYVETICGVAEVKRFVPSIPFSILYPASFLIDGAAKVARLSQPVSPVRIKKLVKSNNILPGYLEKNGYKYKYNLKTAMQDWKDQMPSEW